MEIIEITPQAMNSFRMLIRLIRELDDNAPGVALVKNQAEAVEDMLEASAPTHKQGEG
jgi:hypothetical protein